MVSMHKQALQHMEKEYGSLSPFFGLGMCCHAGIQHGILLMRLCLWLFGATSRFANAQCVAWRHGVAPLCNLKHGDVVWSDLWTVADAKVWSDLWTVANAKSASVVLVWHQTQAVSCYPASSSSTPDKMSN